MFLTCLHIMVLFLLLLPFSTPIAFARVPCAPSVSFIPDDVIMDIVDDESLIMSDDGFQRFLIR